MFVYKYSQLTERKPFIRSAEKTIITSNMHLGQLKLLISEIMFLAKVSKPGNKVVYVGAAEGYHIGYLADMFPELHFDLWDKSKFSVENKKNITIFNKFFMDSDAYDYSEKNKNNILFMSDIRNLQIKRYNEDIVNYDYVIDDDNSKQYRWVKTIKPIAAFLKFRPPYSPGKIKYFDGKIYLQPYSPLSTETRLLVFNYDKEIEYDNVEFDEKLAYFNDIIRQNKNIESKWEKIIKENKIKYNWDNIYAFYVISFYLDKKKNIKNDNETLKLFNDMVKYLQIRYGKKYNAIYEN